MAVRRKVNNNIVSIHSPRLSSVDKGVRKAPLSPAVRRRRLLWLAIMVAFFAWTFVEVVFQSGQIAKKNEELAEVKSQVKVLQEEQQVLQGEIKKLHNEEYMLELAREKYHYYFPGEVPFKSPSDP